MRKILLLLLYFLPLIMWGQRKLDLTGKVGDYLTHGILPKSLVELLTTDSLVIDSTRAGGTMWIDGKTIPMANFKVSVPRPGNYLIRVSYKGYETLYRPVSIPRFHKRELSRTIPDVYLKRAMERQLENVTVTATKIKFYNKGDTLVYNADAFQLGEGSMLDALIRQLPGAELRDGQVYVNGKFISSLLLNGKDFFKGNNQIMLDNLPTYMVNTIKVYDQESKENKFLRINGKKETVMNVNLKKKYNQGWLGNIEAGWGTDKRYLSRAFLMRFTDHSQLTLFGNANNLNDTRKPGQDTEWTPDKMPLGLTTSQQAGAGYSIEDRNERFNIDGNALIRHSDHNEEQLTGRTNFLSGGDTYDRVVNSSTNHDLSFSTEHNFLFTIKKDIARLFISPWFKYDRYDHRNGLYSATSAESFQDWTIARLDSLFLPALSTGLRNRLLNRNIRQGLSRGWHYSGGNYLKLTTKVSKYNNDRLFFSFDNSFKNAHEEGFTLNRIEYPSGNNNQSQFLNQYTPRQPEKGYEYRFNVTYEIALSKGFKLSPFYEYRKSRLTTTRSLYRLDRLQGWDENTSYGLGMLPSESDYLRTIDRNNSFRYNVRDNVHEAGISLWWNFTDKRKSFWWAQMYLPVTHHDYRMQYKRNTVDTLFHRRTTLVSLPVAFLQWESANNRHTVSVQYTVQPDTPDMTYFVDVTDDADPLNITRGNKHLKDSYRHDYTLNYTYTHSEKQLNFNLKNEFFFIKNAIAMQYNYDKDNGIRTFMPVNVNGNWGESVNGNLNFPVNPAKTLTMNYASLFSFNKNVDLATTDGAETAFENRVKSLSWWNNLTLKYQFADNAISLKAGANLIQAKGTRKDFSRISAVDYNYGLTAAVSLPCKFKLSTDLVLYSRRGYDDPSMNTNDIVWNARLSYPVLKGKLLLMADGFDILNQLSNIQRTLNAQGRTEVQTNVIPRYVMFHAIYRFHIMPKKRH